MRHLAGCMLAIVITVAGALACCVAFFPLTGIVMFATSRLFPGAFNEDGPANFIGKAASLIAVFVAVVVGGYVSAWFASHEKRSEIGQACLLGLVLGGFVAISNLGDGMAVPWAVIGPLFAGTLLSALAGGWLRVWQLRRQPKELTGRSANT
jgi:hypothetical protein